MPEPLGGVLGVGERVLAGPLRRQPDAVHPVGAEGVDGQGGDQGGVDAAGHAQHDRGHAVLVDEVAQAQHQCAPDLLGVRQGLHDRARAAARRAAPAPRTARAGSRSSARSGPRAARGPTTGSHGEVDGEQVLDELGRPGQQLAVGGDRHRVAVEDQFVLAADLVAVQDGGVRLGRATAHQRQPQVVLGPLVGGGVGGDDQVDPGLPGDAAGAVARPRGPRRWSARRRRRAAARSAARCPARSSGPRRRRRSWAGAACSSGRRPRRRTAARRRCAGRRRGGWRHRGGRPSAGVRVHRRRPRALGVRQVPDDDGDARPGPARRAGLRGRRRRARWPGRRTPAARGPPADSR